MWKVMKSRSHSRPPSSFYFSSCHPSYVTWWRKQIPRCACHRPPLTGSVHRSFFPSLRAFRRWLSPSCRPSGMGRTTTGGASQSTLRHHMLAQEDKLMDSESIWFGFQNYSHMLAIEVSPWFTLLNPWFIILSAWFTLVGWVFLILRLILGSWDIVDYSPRPRLRSRPILDHLPKR
jgi:hypothetical protein